MKPGVYDMPADEYHRHSALSSTGARKLLECPARFKYERDNPPDPTQAMGFGTVAHRIVLGAGPDIKVYPAVDWKKPSDRAERDSLKREGYLVVLPKEKSVIDDMAAAIQAHPLASRLLSNAQAEQALFWTCQEIGVECRALVDMLRTSGIGVDYKTTADAEPAAFKRSIYKYRYDIQAAWYLDGIRTLGLHREPSFIFVAQEKEPPYLVSVHQLDQLALDVAHRRVIRAREIYRECAAAETWPGYPNEIETVYPPDWAMKEAS